MVHEFFEDQIRLALDVGLKRKAALQSKADAEAYVQLVRQKIRESFGPFPERERSGQSVARACPRLPADCKPFGSVRDVCAFG